MNFDRLTTLTIGLILYAGALVPAPSFGGQAENSREFKIGDSLPSFSLPWLDGKAGTFSFEELKGKPAAIVFWRPHQKFSMDALHDLEALLKELTPERIQIIAIDSVGSAETQAQAALGNGSFSFPVLLDPGRKCYGALGVIVTPTTYLIDDKGIFRYKLASHPRQYTQIIRARLRYMLGDIDQEQMEKEIAPTVLKIEHDLAAAWRLYNLGKELQAGGKTERARQTFQRAVSEYPALPGAHCALGFMKLEQGDLQGAETHFKTALAHQPVSPLARLGEAAVLARTGRTDEAEQSLLALLGYKSIGVRTRYELGRIYHARGQLDRAATFYADALAMMYPEPRSTPDLTTSERNAQTTTQPAAQPGRKAPVTTSPSAPTGTVSSSTPTATGTASIKAITPPADAAYLGVKRCKKCHLQQWKSWKDTKMASAFQLLKPGEATDIKTARNLDPSKDYQQDSTCLACHVTGYGHEGGYKPPPPGDDAALRAAADLAGVGCEGCHGPGSKFSVLHKEILSKKRPYTLDELYALGQYEVSPAVCAACHVPSAPCIAPGYVFDFEQRKVEGTHKHYDLRFRKR